MRYTIQRRNPSRMVRFIASFAALIAIIICGGKIAEAIKYDLITVSGTNGNITVNGNHIEGLNITPALVFNQTGDAITYKTVLTNPDKKPFRIKNITDDNTNTYITTSYEYDNKASDKDKPIFITLTYSSYLPFGDQLDLNDIHITIDIEEEDGGPEQPNDQEEPGGQEKPDNQEQPEREEQSGDKNDSKDPDTPNTGFGGGSTYFKPSSSTESTQILPYIIICIISAAVIITVLPTPKKHRMRFGKIMSLIATVTISGIIFANTFAKSTQIEITIVGKDISAIPESASSQSVVQTIFPNIYNKDVTGGWGNAIILKTLDNKYVLIDTGLDNEQIRNVIYNTLKNLQGTNHVTIDYFIISHLDNDHYGNAEIFINDPNFTFKNIVLKHESKKTVTFEPIAQAAIDHNIHILTSGSPETATYMNTLTDSANYSMISEGMALEVGKYLKLDFFNTTDVYYGQECKIGIGLNWTKNINSPSLYKTANGEYIYFDGSEYSTREDGEYPITSSKYPYSNVTYKTTTTPVAKEGGSGINNYFYALSTDNYKGNICASNPNSYGVFAEVTTTGLKKYMYFPGDIENAGYSLLSSGSNSGQIYDDFVFENGEFKTNVTPYYIHDIRSEDNTATAIYNKLTTDANSLGLSTDDLLQNIVIYQLSHHGINNSEKAVWKLNLNRESGLYAIQESADIIENPSEWRYAKLYYYTLGNVPAENKLRVGISTQDGIDCTINMLGDTTCAAY